MDLAHQVFREQSGRLDRGEQVLVDQLPAGQHREYVRLVVDALLLVDGADPSGRVPALLSRDLPAEVGGLLGVRASLLVRITYVAERPQVFDLRVVVPIGDADLCAVDVHREVVLRADDAEATGQAAPEAWRVLRWAGAGAAVNVIRVPTATSISSGSSGVGL